MNLNFEYLKEKDLEEVAKLYDAERPMNTNMDKMLASFNELKTNPDYYMIVAKINQNIVGFIYAIINHDIFEETKPFITIWNVRVKKEFRNQKIGTKLFQYIEEIAKKLNCDFIALLVEKDNEVANKFYQSLGYDSDNGYSKYIGK